MSDFVEQIIEAHGGLQRWIGLQQVQATIVTGGALWGLKGLQQDATPRRMSVALHEQWASVSPYGAPDRRTAFTPQRIAIETLDGQVVAQRANPRESFAGHAMDTPWDPLQRAYFNGYAMWTYLTTPFFLLWPGVSVQEIEPWRSPSGEWRRLRVHFPRSIATHCEVQDFYFDRDLLLRRHDYSVEVAGGFAAAQYVHDYAEADGIRFPSTRRAFRRGPDNQALEDQLLVSIDLSELQFS